jgi:phage shock protein E
MNLISRKILLILLILVVANEAYTTEEKNVLWIDVRSAEEFSGEHHPLAINIPHTEIADRINEVTTDKNADIRVYCRSGRRSGLAKEALEQMGFTHVTNEGGIDDVLK